MKLKIIFAVLFSIICPGLVLAQTTRPAAGGEMLESKAGKLGYGAENYRIVNERDEIVAVLKNGCVVIAKHVPSPVLAVRGYIGTGGVYEGKWLGGGLSHLLEHLVAGGSSERRSEAENRNLLQEIGNNSNAYTTEDHTAFFINTTADHLDQAADLLTGWLLGAKITPAEYRREYQVVQRELEMGKGEPERQFWYLSNFNRYLVSPARVPVIGYQEVIQGLSRDDVYNYYKLAYVPSNMVFSVAGNLPPEQMLRAIQLNMRDAKPAREFEHNIPAEPPVLAPREIVATFPKLGLAHLSLAFPSVKMTNQDMYPLDLLATILGDGESSILVERLRDEKQLVAGVGSGDETPSYVAGTFEIAMQLDPKNIKAASDETLAVIEEIKTKGVDADRLARAKTQMKMAHVRSLETSESIASQMARDYMSTGDVHFSDRYVERVDRITAADVQEAAKKYLNKQRLLTTALLPSEFTGAAGLAKAEDILRSAVPTTQSKPDQASEVTRVVLDNGTILLHKRITTTPLVQISMYALGGLTAEDEKNNGISNFTMEMLPRGTKTRNAEQIATFFDSIGGGLNTSCGNNSWYWQADCMNKDFAKTMDVFADVVTSPSFPDSEMQGMRQRIMAAIEQQDADWHAQAMHFFRKVYYKPFNSPYQFEVIGEKPNVSAFTAQQLRDWYNSKVLTGRRVLAIFGDIDLATARDVAQKTLANLPKVSAEAPVVQVPQIKSYPAGKATAVVERVETLKTEKPLAGVVIGYDSDSVIGDPGNYALTVADTITSGYTYPTGYLHEILRGRGLVYVVHALNWPGRNIADKGTFFVYAGCDPTKVNEVVDVILENIARVQGTPEEINMKWFDRSKKLITTADAMENETPSSQASTAALDELYGLGYDYHRKFATQVNAVNLQEVQAVGRNRLRQCVVTISTPQPELVTIKTGTRTYDSFAPVDLTPRGVQHDTSSK